MIFLPSTVSPLELVWTVETTAGIALALALHRFWYQKLVYLHEKKLNGVREMIVRSHLGRKLFYLLSHLGFVLVGVLAATLPTRAPTTLQAQITAPISALVFIGVAVGMQRDMIVSYFRYRHIEEVDDATLKIGKHP